MGQCSNVQNLNKDDTSRSQIQSQQVSIIRSLILQHQNQVILQKSDETTQSFDITIYNQKLPKNKQIKLLHQVNSSCFITSEAQIIYIVEFHNYQSNSLLNALKFYSNLKNLALKGNSTFSNVFQSVIIKKENQTSTFFIKSGSICQRAVVKQKINKRYVSLVKLTNHINKMNTFWFDQQLCQIIKKCFFLMSKMHKNYHYKMQEIVIGPNNDVCILGGGIRKNVRSTRDQLRDRHTFINYFQNLILTKHKTQIQKQKYKNTFYLLQKLLKLDFSEQYIPDINIKTFVNDYIQSYVSQKHQYTNLVKAYQSLGIFQIPKQILLEKLQASIYKDKYSSNSLKIYEQLIKNGDIDEKTNIQYLNNAMEIYILEGEKDQLQGNYNSSLWNYQKALMISQKIKILSEQLYIKAGKISLLLNKMDQSQQIFRKGLTHFPKSKRLLFQLINYYIIILDYEAVQLIVQCCGPTKRLTQSQKILVNSKILVVKKICGIITQQDLQNYTPTVNECVEIMQKQNNQLLYDIYYVLADCYLYTKKYKLALQNYNSTLVLLKNSKYNKIWPVLVQIGHCYLMLHQYSQALVSYKNALQKISPELSQIRSNIIGNMGIVEIACGKAQQGTQTLQYSINQIKLQYPQENNINYLFFIKKKQLEQNLLKKKDADSPVSSK